MKKKQRLDVALFEAGLAPSREKARAMIMAGEVSANNVMIDKPGTKIALDAKLSVKNKPRYVSRGGEKLEGALTSFDYDPTGKICADVGASTGGFTDCLLQHGALKVYAIDVGYGQLAHSLRIDDRVIVIERTNARYLEALDEPVDLIVIDVSFISLTIILPVVQQWLRDSGEIITLIKPQFEAGKQDVGKGGVVKNTDVHAQVLRKVLQFAQEIGFEIMGLTRSPIQGPKGNIEFLAWLRLHSQESKQEQSPQIETLIQESIASI